MFKKAVRKKIRPLLRPMKDKKEERPRTPEKLHNLLNPTENLDLESIETGSELSDVFQEVHKESFVKLRVGNHLISKTEADRMTINLFSDLYKKTAAKVREDLNISDNLFNEDLDAIIQSLNEPREGQKPSKEDKERYEAILRDEEYFEDPSEEITLVKGEVEAESASSYDALSGVWRRIECECKDKEEFQVTYPNFDLHRQGEPHWLDVQPLPKEELDEAIRKCRKWLREQTF